MGAPHFARCHPFLHFQPIALMGAFRVVLMICIAGFTAGESVLPRHWTCSRKADYCALCCSARGLDLKVFIPGPAFDGECPSLCRALWQEHEAAVRGQVPHSHRGARCLTATARGARGVRLESRRSAEPRRASQPGAPGVQTRRFSGVSGESI